MDKRHSSGTWLINGCALQKTPTHNPLGARTAVHILPIGGSTEVQDRSAGRKGHFTPTHCSNYKSSKPRPVTQTQLFIGLIGVRAEWIEHHELRIALLQSYSTNWKTTKNPTLVEQWYKTSIYFSEAGISSSPCSYTLPNYKHDFQLFVSHEKGSNGLAYMTAVMTPEQRLGKGKQSLTYYSSRLDHEAQG